MKLKILFISLIVGFMFSACSIFSPKAKKPINYSSPCACYDVEIRTQVKG